MQVFLYLETEKMFRFSNELQIAFAILDGS